jgi:hypothetical protein
MKKLKRVLRILGLIFLVLLAACGVGFAVGLPRREQDRDNQVKTELVEGKEEDIDLEQRS